MNQEIRLHPSNPAQALKEIERIHGEKGVDAFLEGYVDPQQPQPGPSLTRIQSQQAAGEALATHGQAGAEAFFDGYVEAFAPAP
ncbi:hypothetical protein ACFLZP_04355 [Patescibacteria group bacterium]